MKYRVRRPELGWLLSGIPVDVYQDEDDLAGPPCYTFLLPDIQRPDDDPPDPLIEPGTWLMERLLERDLLAQHNQRVSQVRSVRHAAFTTAMAPYIGAVLTSKQVRETLVQDSGEESPA